MRYLLLFCICLVSWLRLCQASQVPAPSPPPPSSSSFCSDLRELPILYDIRFQCPVSFQPNPPLQVSGDAFEEALASKWRTGYSSVLFYASWCPFSMNVRATFDSLSSMYPQIEHFSIEQSSAMPSLFSRYGIHSVPAILLVNQTSQRQYHGSKDLASLIIFYKQVTGHGPVHYFPVEQSGSLETGGDIIMQSWIGASADEMWRREPFLIVSVLFLILRVVLYAFQRILNNFRQTWASYHLHLNLEIFGETRRQIFGRILHLIDVKRIWTKLKLSKSRNFHRGARNAKAWASLASVSLGKTSTSGQLS